MTHVKCPFCGVVYTPGGPGLQQHNCFGQLSQQFLDQWSKMTSSQYIYDRYIHDRSEALFERLNEKWSWCSGCGDVFDISRDIQHRCPDSNVGADRDQSLSVIHLIKIEDDFYMTPSQTQQSVRIWWDASVQAYRLASPFNKALVDALKQHIPVSDRSYDPQTKIWTFVEKQLAALQALLTIIGLPPIVITRQQVEQQQQQQAASQSQSNGSLPATQRGLPLSDVVLQFVRVVPYDAMLKAYRLAALALHPDRGGSPDAMSTLNATWSRLEKDIYGR